MTEEEKKAKLQELREKLAEKRALQAKEDVKATKANEALRRKAGQVSILKGLHRSSLDRGDLFDWRERDKHPAGYVVLADRRAGE